MAGAKGALLTACCAASTPYPFAQQAEESAVMNGRTAVG